MFLYKEDASSRADVKHIKEVGAFGCLVLGLNLELHSYEACPHIELRPSWQELFHLLFSTRMVAGIENTSSP